MRTRIFHQWLPIAILIAVALVVGMSRRAFPSHPQEDRWATIRKVSKPINNGSTSKDPENKDH
jgi:hypothetical protein